LRIRQIVERLREAPSAASKARIVSAPASSPAASV